MTRTLLIWGGLLLATGVPVAVAALSPFLAYREPAYVVAGLAGVLTLPLILLQPLLALGVLPGLSFRQSRRLHRLAGGALVAAVLVHVAGLWLTSPPDVLDALAFTSPAPFSVWGVVAMWAALAAAAVAALRRKLRPATWRLGHRGLVAMVAAGGVVHALLIEGTMGPVSKAVLCALVLGATGWALVSRRG